ncbi:DNA cytosine methyltransferase [Streptomyces aidingensis]|uniref:Cytosine-specific methyltransferase n=1 Tax=Streptomyces aidingensis TaxID=910347 RepID=A0A1I1TVS2_9ACTN|nr:DNA cytosine methyltransferase [Streptomyces aidingensis]SFD62629.1 DNA (cytosine-5)-methyltransferase 1 [Streptomyces aidingensis]
MTPAPQSEPIKIADLFAGCGGFTQGFYSFRPEGQEDRPEPFFRSVLAIENNHSAAATYAANFASEPGAGAHVHNEDIEKWEPAHDEIEADVVLGGPPCQGFSGLGPGKPDDPRNKLWRHYVEIVSKIIEPKVFVIENVDRFLRSLEFHQLVEETKPGGMLEKYRLIDPPGGSVDEKMPREKRYRRYLLNAANYGVRQKRRRAIVIGVHKDIPEVADLQYPEPTHADPRKLASEPEDTLFASNRILPWRTVDDVFKQSAHMQLKDDLEMGPDGCCLTTELHIRRHPEELSLARYAAIPEGGNRKHLVGRSYKVDRFGVIRLSGEPGYASIKGTERYLSTESWDNHNNGSGDVMGRLRMNEPAVTIRTEFFKPEKGRYLHPSEPRPITHFEAARLQGFPETFKWCGSKTEIARQIGNAVPVELGQQIARAIYRALRG